MTIITQGGKPVAVATNDEVDFYKVISGVREINKKEKIEYEDYRFNLSQENKSVAEYLNDENLIVWKWNKIANSFYQRELNR